mgnify:CR=1 FL=1
MLKRLKILSVLLALSITFCLPQLSAAEKYTANECFEKLSRGTLKFNQGLDKAVFKPIAKGFRALPLPIRTGTSNFVGNLRSLLTFTNNILQVDIYNAQSTTLRFLINSIFGIGGIFDPATRLGLERKDTNFGETLEKYGFGPGFYVVLPILGPSTFRDAIGIGVDQIIDPLNFASKNLQNNWLQPTKTSIRGVDFRERNLNTIDSLKDTSLDYYATLRSLYLQRRKNIANSDKYDIPSLDLDDDEDLNEDGTCCVYVETTKEE